MPFIFLVAAVFSFLPLSSQAEIFYVDGYTVSLYAHQNHANAFGVTGRIGKGPECREVKIIYNIVGQRGDRARLNTKVKDVSPSVSRIIDQNIQLKFPQQRWTVEDVSVKCLYR